MLAMALCNKTTKKKNNKVKTIEVITTQELNNFF
jgi:hypothetical protein